jgi:hypothetical protein
LPPWKFPLPACIFWDLGAHLHSLNAFCLLTSLHAIASADVLNIFIGLNALYGLARLDTLIWFGAPDRSGNIGLHRPWTDAFESLTPAHASIRYKRYLEIVHRYL